MTTKVRVWIVGVTLVAVAGLIGSSDSSYAGDEKSIRDAVIKIAALIKKGDKDGAKALATTTAKKIDEIGDLMHMFRPRNKGGTGVGSTAGANAAKDGLEVKLRDLARDVPAGVAKEAMSLEEAGYYIAALGELSAAKGWAKDTGKKTKKAWAGWSNDMQEAGVAFAKASAAKGGQEIKTAAAKVNASCNNCHSVFKE